MLNSSCKLKWGISADILRKIWSGVVEPMVLYASPAWASCIDKKWLSNKLESLQRLIAIKIVKSFKCVSYEASMHLSGLSPIMQKLKEKCLSYAAKHKSYYLTAPPQLPHVSNILKLSNEFNIDISMYATPSPPYLPPYAKSSPSVVIDLATAFPLRETNSINIYTDGSKTGDGTGAAFIMFPPSSTLRHGSYMLNDSNSVYQAELYAILNSLKDLFHMSLYIIRSSHIKIFCDSQAALLSIKDLDTKDYTAHEIQKYLTFFSSITNICLYWCKAHSKVLGNEVADFLAKISTKRGINHKSRIQFPISELKQSIKKQEKLNWLSRWETSSNARTTFSFMPGLPPKHYSKIRYNHKMTQILTGHSRLNMYLSDIGIKDVDPACECGDSIETLDHYLFHCVIEKDNRINTIEKASMINNLPFPPPRHILIGHPKLYESLIAYLQNSNRLEFT